MFQLLLGENVFQVLQVCRRQIDKVLIQVSCASHSLPQKPFEMILKNFALANMVLNQSIRAHQLRNVVLCPAPVCPQMKKLGVSIPFLYPGQSRALSPSAFIHHCKAQQLALQHASHTI